ncbi:nicotinate-nucleotide adenylyltransferase [Waterburya agarophytonicola K14]|uniref:nicotinate-nucleotide adenylyltransferase n=1 Tax=Waterburya agarophytonicola KI4 TaxID=2874699 RepID=A0A964FGW7_9CYAN|nr:nicotinate-nucleotide adenylyltransferase [Waterburya agarophytonicola]MCC0178467.1 nicotinate-nucleotide adenylyltransferase [Waterburya agarophytonicola KI4]
MEKIALFGTSADPPTVGHQTILHWLSQHYDRVVVWASDNPFKKHQTPLIYRTEMLGLAIADLNLPRNNINLHPELSDRYTLVTANKAREKWGDKVEFSLVIGSDILGQITSWYRIGELLAQVKVLVVPRLGYGIKEADLCALNKVGGKVAIATLNAPKVSSSTYRLEKDNSLITPAVNNYIWQKNLYNVENQVISNK